ncbi:MAG: nucleoside deaminase [Bradyrhizobiaceae bacterium]|nr:nucleoside deaminase [Bradyrhizobiaceae bacterium]
MAELNERDREFMGLALALARENAASAEGGPFGAVVVHEGKVVGEGRNRVTATNDPTAHAEIVAIREAARKLNRFDLKGCAVYTSCEPCPMCLAAAYWARVDRVVYAATQHEAAAAGFDDAFLYDELAKHQSERQLKLIQLKTDHEDPFAVWLANPNRIPY